MLRLSGKMARAMEVTLVCKGRGLEFRPRGLGLLVLQEKRGSWIFIIENQMARTWRNNMGPRVR